MIASKRSVAICVVLACCMAMGHAQEPTRRLRTLLPNGATLLVENLPEAASASVQLFASSRRVPDTPENHGFKHLLEHLLLKGRNKDLDLRLETEGIFFSGRTLRDAMQIEFTCTASQIPKTMAALKELLEPIQASDADVAAEVEVMKQEEVLSGDPQRLSQAAWKLAYGEQGLDPFGDLGVMSSATPEALEVFQKQLFAADNLVLVISGPVNVEAMTKVGTALLAAQSGSSGEKSSTRGLGKAGRVELQDGFGEARAARVGSFRDASTAQALAAALGIASQMESVFVTYTPSADNGLVIIGHSDMNTGVGMKIDSLDPGEIAALFPIGKALARRWVLRQLQSPSSSASLRGLLLTESPNNRPDDLLSNIDHMTWQQFLNGVTLFKEENADVAVGVRR